MTRCASGWLDAAPARKPIRLQSLFREALDSRPNSDCQAENLRRRRRCRSVAVPATAATRIPSRRTSPQPASPRFFQKEEPLLQGPAGTAQPAWCSRCRTYWPMRPFSRLDMVSCRNLLIYLQPDARGKGADPAALRVAPRTACCCSAARKPPKIVDDRFELHCEVGAALPPCRPRAAERTGIPVQWR